MKTRREEAHAHLQDALFALGDDGGRDEWGPGPVGIKLYWIDMWAADAFDMATSIVAGANGLSSTTLRITAEADQKAFTAALKKLAPVLLDVMCDLRGIE